MTTNHSYILFFTNKGRAYRLKAYEIPEASRTARGTALVNLLQLMPDEHVTTVLPIREISENMCLIMATKRGVVKRTPLTAFSNIRKTGLAAISIPENDELIEVKWDDANQDLILITKEGMSIRFNVTDIRKTGRSAYGVRGVLLQEDDEVVNMITENQGSHILCISEKGLGKLTKMSEFRLQHRGGRGIKCYKVTEKSGKLIGARAVNESDELLLITTEGVMIRTGCAEISILGRNTTGVKIMDLREGETVAGLTKVKMDSVEEAEDELEEAIEGISEELAGEAETEAAEGTSEELAGEVEAEAAERTSEELAGEAEAEAEAAEGTSEESSEEAEEGTAGESEQQ